MDVTENSTMTYDVIMTSTITSSVRTYEIVIDDTEDNTSRSSATVMVTQGILYGVLLVFGMLFNCCVIWIIRNKRSLHTVTNMWVTSLCVSQTLLCGISLPLIILSVIADDWILGSIFCRIFGFYTTCLRTVSILSVAGIALDRYHVITRPFSSRIRKSSARFLIFTTWWSGAVASTPPLIGIGLYRYSPNSHVCGISWSLGGSALTFTVFYVTSVYIVTLLTSCFSYKLIYEVTKNQAEKRRKPTHAGGLATSLSSSNIRRSDASEPEFINGGAINNEAFSITNDVIVQTRRGSPAKRRLQAVNPPKSSRPRMSLRNRLSSTISGAYISSNIDSRAALTIGLVLSVFLITWVPYFGFALYVAIAGGNGPTYPKRPGQTMSSSAHMWAEFATTWLSFSSVVWDPLVYGFLNHNFRIHLREMYCCCRGRLHNFKGSARHNPTNGDIYDEIHRERSTAVAANWRAIMKTEETTERESTVYFAATNGYSQRESYLEDSQEQTSESARTMTSVDGDVIFSPSSRRQSTFAGRHVAAPKIFFTPVSSDEETERTVAHTHEQANGRSFSTIQTKSAKRNAITKFGSSPARSLASQQYRSTSHFASRSSTLDDVTRPGTSHQLSNGLFSSSRNSILDDVIDARQNSHVLTSSPYRRGSIFSNKHEIRGYHSHRPLPMVLVERDRASPMTSLNSFRLNERLSSSRRYNKTKLTAKKSEKSRTGKESDIFFTKGPQKEARRTKHASQSQSTTPTHKVYEPFPNRRNHLYYSNRSLDPRYQTTAIYTSPSRQSNAENGRRGTEGVGESPARKPAQYESNQKQRRRYKSATAL